MSSPASIAGHPIHPMLVPLPIGLWVFSFVADLVALSNGGGGWWPEIAFYTMLGGLVILYSVNLWLRWDLASGSRSFMAGGWAVLAYCGICTTSSP
jgi:uncharacterized membrane protein